VHILLTHFTNTNVFHLGELNYKILLPFNYDALL